VVIVESSLVREVVRGDGEAGWPGDGFPVHQEEQSSRSPFLKFGHIKSQNSGQFRPLKSKNRAFFGSKNKIIDMFWVNGIYFE